MTIDAAPLGEGVTQGRAGREGEVRRPQSASFPTPALRGAPLCDAATCFCGLIGRLVFFLPVTWLCFPQPLLIVLSLLLLLPLLLKLLPRLRPCQVPRTRRLGGAPRPKNHGIA